MKEWSIGKWVLVGAVTLALVALVYVLCVPVPYQLGDKPEYHGQRDRLIRDSLQALDVEYIPGGDHYYPQGDRNVDPQYSIADVMWRGHKFEARFEYVYSKRDLLRRESLLTASRKDLGPMAVGEFASYRRTGDFCTIMRGRDTGPESREAAAGLAEMIHAQVLAGAKVMYRPRAYDLGEKIRMRFWEVYGETRKGLKNFRDEVRRKLGLIR